MKQVSVEVKLAPGLTGVDNSMIDALVACIQEASAVVAQMYPGDHVDPSEVGVGVVQLAFGSRPAYKVDIVITRLSDVACTPSLDSEQSAALLGLRELISRQRLTCRIAFVVNTALVLSTEPTSTPAAQPR